LQVTPVYVRSSGMLDARPDPLSSAEA